MRQASPFPSVPFGILLYKKADRDRVWEMPRPIRPIPVTSEQRSELQRIVSKPTSSQRMVRRCRMILLRADGKGQEDVAADLMVNRPVVAKWEKRFINGGVAGLEEAKRSGRKPTISEDLKSQIIAEATRPPSGYTQWSTRKMARAKGVSNQTVHKLWAANDIKPHIKRTFKLSNDKHFDAKFWDVIGLYLNPPEKALVLCCDEKSQCQALERTQPGLPLGVGHVRTATHDYIRHGTITLFAALDYLNGKIFRDTAPNHTHAQWLGFLKKLDKETPGDFTLHLILDNYATHKHPKVMSWIKWRNQRQRTQHGIERVVLHFTPTSSSWMNLVERFFRDLTVDCVRDGSFASVPELIGAINAYLAERDLNPVRYQWKAQGAEILAKIERARKAAEANGL
jgi:transposase